MERRDNANGTRSDAARQVADRAPALILYARQWTADRTAADDAVQAALVGLLSSRVVPGDPVAWAYRAVRNAAIDGARSTARRRRRERTTAAIDWFDPSPGDALDAATAEAALRQLPPELLEAVVLRVWGELGFAAMADVAGCSVSTAHARYAAGLDRLRQVMEPTARTEQRR